VAAAQGGIRTEVGAIYRTALNGGQAVQRARPPDVFHHVTYASGLVGCDAYRSSVFNGHAAAETFVSPRASRSGSKSRP
jgi:hypothetical protein